MRKRVYTGEHGRLTGDGRVPMGFAVPETVKIYYRRFSFRLAAQEEFVAVSSDLRWWVFGDALYLFSLQDGAVPELVMAEGVGEYVGKGQEWMLLSHTLLLRDSSYAADLPCPLPDVRATLGSPWVPRVVEGGDLRESPVYLPSVTDSSSWIAGRWGYCPVDFSFYRENSEWHRLEAYIRKLTHPGVVQVFRKKQSAFLPRELTRANPAGIYSFDFYDTLAGPEGEISFRLAPYGGAWTEGKELFTHGSTTGGIGYFLPVVFGGDGTCLGFAGINNLQVATGSEAYFLPTEKGALMTSPEEGEGVALMPPVQAPSSAWEKGSGTTVSFPREQPGTTQGKGYLTGEGVGAFPPQFYFLGEDLLRGWVPPLYGESERIYGGEASTVSSWVDEGVGGYLRPFGPFLPVRMPVGDRVIDMRSLRRHLLAGQYASVEHRNGAWWANALDMKTERLEGEIGHEIRVNATPLGTTRPTYSIRQNILAEHIIAPWLAAVGEALEIGWWDFPQVGLKGSPPNHAWLNKDWSGQEFWMWGGPDHLWGDIGWARASFSVTSDGYIYISSELQSGGVTSIGFKFNGSEWMAGRSDYTVSSTLVAPFGQGCYYTYHFPGEDWSIFHAPVGEVIYRRMFEKTDWSFLHAYTGLAGGFALAGQLQVQEAFDKYTEASLGNLMLIYTNPRQLLAVGDPLFEQSSPIVREDNSFWTFAGWARIDDQPKAVFSRIRNMRAGSPEVWAVGREGARQINPSEAGGVGEQAFGLIPSNYYPKFGVRQEETVMHEGWSLLFGEGHYYYPLPEMPQEADAALAQEYLDTLRAWEGKAADINRPRVLVGQAFNHQVLTSAVIDPSVPLMDARIQVIDGVTWVLLQHVSGIWFSVRGDVDFERYDFEQGVDWQLISLGVERDGTVVGLFYNGVLDMDTYRTFDYQLQLYWGMGQIWRNQAIWKWPARIIPVILAQSLADLIKMEKLFYKEKGDQGCQ